MNNSKPSNFGFSPISRRKLCTSLMSTATILTNKTASAANASHDKTDLLWQMFCNNFITTEGRIVDTGNGNVSHSEGQGYGLIFSAYYGDEQKFRSILSWTQQTLRRRRGDTLHAWRFRPDVRLPVEDLNNATDGDLLIAFGLLRGGRLWNRPELVQQAKLLYMDILHLSTIDSEGWLLLLPAVSGFEKSGNVVVNLSYLVFPSLLAALTLVTDPASRQSLHRLINDGVRMIGLAAFGQWKLPPDWLQVSRSSELAPAQGWPPRFSYDAIRIPLYLLSIPVECWFFRTFRAVIPAKDRASA